MAVCMAMNVGRWLDKSLWNIAPRDVLSTECVWGKWGGTVLQMLWSAPTACSCFIFFYLSSDLRLASAHRKMMDVGTACAALSPSPRFSMEKGGVCNWSSITFQTIRRMDGVEPTQTTLYPNKSTGLFSIPPPLEDPILHRSLNATSSTFPSTSLPAHSIPTSILFLSPTRWSPGVHDPSLSPIFPFLPLPLNFCLSYQASSVPQARGGTFLSRTANRQQVARGGSFLFFFFFRQSLYSPRFPLLGASPSDVSRSHRPPPSLSVCLSIYLQRECEYEHERSCCVGAWC
jgi:hypothetical protein